MVGFLSQSQSQMMSAICYQLVHLDETKPWAALAQLAHVHMDEGTLVGFLYQSQAQMMAVSHYHLIWLENQQHLKEELAHWDQSDNGLFHQPWRNHDQSHALIHMDEGALVGFLYQSQAQMMAILHCQLIHLENQPHSKDELACWDQSDSGKSHQPSQNHDQSHALIHMDKGELVGFMY